MVTKYKRVLLKISGEALLGNQQFGIDYEPVEMIANEIKSIYDKGVEVAVVVGGGNIFRGMKNSANLRRLCRNARYSYERGCFAMCPQKNKCRMQSSNSNCHESDCRAIRSSQSDKTS